MKSRGAGPSCTSRRMLTSATADVAMADVAPGLHSLSRSSGAPLMYFSVPMRLLFQAPGSPSFTAGHREQCELVARALSPHQHPGRHADHASSSCGTTRHPPDRETAEHGCSKAGIEEATAQVGDIPLAKRFAGRRVQML